MSAHALGEPGRLHHVTGVLGSDGQLRAKPLLEDSLIDGQPQWRVPRLSHSDLNQDARRTARDVEATRTARVAHEQQGQRGRAAGSEVLPRPRAKAGNLGGHLARVEAGEAQPCCAVDAFRCIETCAAEGTGDEARAPERPAADRQALFGVRSQAGSSPGVRTEALRVDAQAHGHRPILEGDRKEQEIFTSATKVIRIEGAAAGRDLAERAGPNGVLQREWRVHGSLEPEADLITTQRDGPLPIPRAQLGRNGPGPACELRGCALRSDRDKNLGGRAIRA